jgi:hypothetical protein
MSDRELTVVDGPDKPALQWALLYLDRGQNVIFKIEDEAVQANIVEMDEIGNGFDFGLKGTVTSGRHKGLPFHGTYSVESRSGRLMLAGQQGQ